MKISYIFQQHCLSSTDDKHDCLQKYIFTFIVVPSMFVAAFVFYYWEKSFNSISLLIPLSLSKWNRFFIILRKLQRNNKERYTLEKS